MDRKLKVAEKVRLLLSLRDLSLKELSAQSGLPYTTLSKVQNGAQIPSLEQLNLISDACGVHPIYWIENVRPDLCILMMEKLPTALSLAKLPETVCKYLEHGIQAMKNYEDISMQLPRASTLGKMKISEKYYAYADGEEWRIDDEGTASTQRSHKK
jgi:transcriptional regulator with XRE-family HTH domain